MSMRIFAGTFASAVNIAAFSVITSSCTPAEQNLFAGYEFAGPTATPSETASIPQEVGASQPPQDCALAWQTQFGNAINHAETSGPRATAPEFINHINALRSLQCLCEGKPVGPAPALAWNESLATAALENATSRASRASIKIDDASKAITLNRALKAGYPAQSITEYSAYGPTTSFSFFKALIQSPQICTKFMDPQLQDVGAAYAVGNSAPPNEPTLPETKHYYWNILLGEQISLSRPF